MNFLIDVLKGAVIGIANIIPGVSGGTMAVTMGIYDKMIGAVNKIFKKFKESIKILIPIGIGMVLGIAVGILGLAGCGINYSIYKKMLEKGKAKYAYEIVELARQISEQ